LYENIGFLLPSSTWFNAIKFTRILTINHQMLDSWWTDEFIPSELQENSMCVDHPDSHEREGYSIQLDRGSYENDFHATLDTAPDLSNNEPPGWQVPCLQILTVNVRTLTGAS
jgi:hypothetical protein